jgi:putative flippase GtrA
MKFFLYCLCGGVGVVTDLIIYLISLKLGLSYLVANAVGYFFGTVISFILNRKITFGLADKVALRFGAFLCVAAIGFSASSILLWSMVSFLNIGEQTAKFFTLPAVVMLQFLLNKQLTFNEAFVLNFLRKSK